jgi:hypothetical protein
MFIVKFGLPEGKKVPPPKGHGAGIAITPMLVSVHLEDYELT